MGLVRAQVELDREVAHDLVVPVVLLPHLVEVLEHFKAVLEVLDLEVLEVHDLEVLELHDLEVLEVHDPEVPEVHDLEVLEVHYLLKAAEGELVERPLSNSALLLHLVESLDLCREAAAQEVLLVWVESVQQMVSVMQAVHLQPQPKKNFAFLLPT